MDQEKAAKAHIDFLIDDDVKESLGITGRTLSQQVLRLCGGFNELVELTAEVIVELTWMIAHFDWARQQTGLNDEPSPELKRAKKVLEKLEQKQDN